MVKRCYKCKKIIQRHESKCRDCILIQLQQEKIEATKVVTNIIGTET